VVAIGTGVPGSGWAAGAGAGASAGAGADAVADPGADATAADGAAEREPTPREAAQR
jgi:hypothetical protein